MRELPELFERPVKARSLAYVFTAGGLLGLVTLASPHGDDVNDLAVFVLAALALAIAAVFYARAQSVAEWQLGGALAAGTLILTLANYYVGLTALYPILYSWLALYAFYFFPLRRALAHIAFIGLVYLALLVVQDPPSQAVRWLLVIGTPTVAGLLISRLLDRLRAEAERVGEQARALRESDTRLRLVLQTAHDAFTMIGRDGNVITWNGAAERMFGWPAPDAMGRPLRALIFPPEAREEHDERRESLLASRESVTERRLELELQRRDGSRFPAEATISRVSAGEEPVLAMFIRDLSERRRREEQREALLREQAARAEAERVVETVAGMQVLVDAALAHRTLDEILAELVPRVREVLRADAASAFLAEEGEWLVMRASTADSGDGASPARFPLGEGFAGLVAAERRAMLLQDPPEEDLLDPALRDLEVGSVIAVPLLVEGQVAGVIQVASTSRRRFNEEDVALLRLAGDRVALAIDHARVYEREHRIAETLQRSLLPERLPQLPGLAAAARYAPAAEEAEVGGDWYDVIPIAGGGIGLVMGDVAGKGLAAASMVGKLRSALRAYALEGHQPANVVERLNRLVWAELEESQMATLLYVVLDPADGAVRWVNAGHVPPLVLTGEGVTRFLEGGQSVPLGVLPFPGFEEMSAELEPGSTVMLYTDGLVERPGAHIDEGLAKLAEVVARARGTPDELCEHVLGAMVPAGGAADDVALLALRNTPMADRFRVEVPTDPEALSSMRGLLRRWLRHVAGSEQEIAEITTACGEAATNAIEHAGAGGGAAFEVDGRLRGREVAITVRDYGAWREPRERDQGRGLSLMRALMDDVEVTPSAGGTTVRLRRTLNGDGRA